MGVTNTYKDMYSDSRKTCKDCGKDFYAFHSEYVYKIVRTGGRVDWYCCYTHWIKAVRAREERVARRKNIGGKKQ